MDSKAFGGLFEALDMERQSMTARVESLRADLADAEGRLRDLEGVMAGLQRLDLVAPEPKSSPEGSEPPSVGRSPSALDPVETPAPAVEQHSVKQRIRSTDLVASMVNEINRPLTRDEVLREFEIRIGFPASWTNPRNAIGNALVRASAKGLISALEGDRWAPAHWLSPEFGAATGGGPHE